MVVLRVEGASFEARSRDVAFSKLKLSASKIDY